MKEYYSGDYFGELALLYNAPRAASIYAKADDCVLWGLDRETFNNIVKEASIKRREHYITFLKNTEILKNLSDHEINQITDAIRIERIVKGTKVISQGHLGDKFYFLEEGKATAYKMFDDFDTEKEVMKYNKSDFFGELALMKNEPRAASVITDTDCIFLTLDRGSFKRLLGPLEMIMKNKSEAYKTS